jgi:hypothetical protein
VPDNNINMLDLKKNESGSGSANPNFTAVTFSIFDSLPLKLTVFSYYRLDAVKHWLVRK